MLTTFSGTVSGEIGQVSLYIQTSLASNIFLFNSSEFNCATLAQTHSFSNNFISHLYAATCHKVFPCLSSSSNNLSGFICPSLAKLHNVSNTSKKHHFAVRCHTVSPYFCLVTFYPLTPLNSRALSWPRSIVSVLFLLPCYSTMLLA